MGLRTAATASRAGLVAAIIALAVVSTGSAQAAPFAPPPGVADRIDGDVIPAQYGWGRHDDYGRDRDHGDHRGWGHRHHGWGDRHDGWGHRRHDGHHRHGGHRGFYRY